MGVHTAGSGRGFTNKVMPPGQSSCSRHFFPKREVAEIRMRLGGYIFNHAVKLPDISQGCAVYGQGICH